MYSFFGQCFFFEKTEKRQCLTFAAFKKKHGYHALFPPACLANLRITRRNRAGSFIHPEFQQEQAYAPFTLTDLRLVHNSKYMRVFAEATNVFDVQYADLGALIQPGIWLRVGLEIQLDLVRK
jgi:vitamin B12 transporter